MNSPLPFGVVRLHYVLETWHSDKIVYDIFPQGKVTVKEYRYGSRKCCSSRVYSAPQDAVTELIVNINGCIRGAVGCIIACDNCTGTLTVYHDNTLTETMDRGLYSQSASIDSLLEEFISSVTENSGSALSSEK